MNYDALSNAVADGAHLTAHSTAERAVREHVADGDRSISDVNRATGVHVHVSPARSANVRPVRSRLSSRPTVTTLRADAATTAAKPEACRRTGGRRRLTVRARARPGRGWRDQAHCRDESTPDPGGPRTLHRMSRPSGGAAGVAIDLPPDPSWLHETHTRIARNLSVHSSAPPGSPAPVRSRRTRRGRRRRCTGHVSARTPPPAAPTSAHPRRRGAPPRSRRRSRGRPRRSARRTRRSHPCR